LIAEENQNVLAKIEIPEPDARDHVPCVHPDRIGSPGCPQTRAHGQSIGDYASRWDIFAGYSYLAPKGTVDVPQGNGTTIPYSYNAVNLGGLFSGAYYFNKYVGAQVEVGFHEWGDADPNGSNNGTHGNDDGFTTASGGIIFRYPTATLRRLSMVW
jgi:hypothetical protein